MTHSRYTNGGVCWENCSFAPCCDVGEPAGDECCCSVGDCVTLLSTGDICGLTVFTTTISNTRSLYTVQPQLTQSGDRQPPGALLILL